MAGVDEQFRRKIAYLLAGIGLFFLLTGIALVIDNHFELQSRAAKIQPRATQPATTAQVQAKARAEASAMQRFLFWLLILLGIFVIGSLAFWRWSRSFRRWMLHEPANPTPAEDVWTMHRLPDHTRQGQQEPGEQE